MVGSLVRAIRVRDIRVRDNTETGGARHDDHEQERGALPERSGPMTITMSPVSL